MQRGIRLLFFGVFAMMLLPMAVGTMLVLGTTTMTVAEYAPTREDAAYAEELEERAAAAGMEMEVSAVEIAQARRLGQLEQVETVAQHRFGEVDPEDGMDARSVADAPKRMAGAYYPDAEAEDESEPAFPWVWAGVAFASAAAFIGALAFVFLSLGKGDDERASSEEAQLDL
ncbi:MAG: hypothetical protein R3F61_14560 [Myxococcota bacterium]